MKKMENGEKPAIEVKGGKVTKSAKFVKASKEDRTINPQTKKMCGQDTSILGGSGAKMGGHAGHGQSGV